MTSVNCCACKRSFTFSKNFFIRKGWKDPKFCKGCYYLWYRTCAEKGIFLDPKKEIDTSMFEERSGTKSGTKITITVTQRYEYYLYDSDLEGDNVGEYYVSE